MTTSTIDHSTCAADAHDRTLSNDDQPLIAPDGLLACQDCGLPAFYCANDENFHHVDAAAPGCFLIHDEERVN